MGRYWDSNPEHSGTTGNTSDVDPKEINTSSITESAPTAISAPTRPVDTPDNGVTCGTQHIAQIEGSYRDGPAQPAIVAEIAAPSFTEGQLATNNDFDSNQSNGEDGLRGIPSLTDEVDN